MGTMPSMKQQTITRMMAGLSNRQVFPEEHRKLVEDKYGDLIDKIIKAMPKPTDKRSWASSIYAATVKAFIRFGEEKGTAFINSYKGNFKGENDPALGLLQICFGKNGDSNTIYRRAITAIRAHCMDRRVKSIREAQEDLLDWNEKDFVIPIRSNKKKPKPKREKTEFSENSRQAAIRNSRRPRDRMGTYLPGHWETEELFVCEDGTRIIVKELDDDTMEALMQQILKLREEDCLAWGKISNEVENWLESKIKDFDKGNPGNRKWGPTRCRKVYIEYKEKHGEPYTTRAIPRKQLEALKKQEEPKELFASTAMESEKLTPSFNLIRNALKKWVDEFYQV